MRTRDPPIKKRQRNTSIVAARIVVVVGLLLLLAACRRQTAPPPISAAIARSPLLWAGSDVLGRAPWVARVPKQSGVSISMNDIDRKGARLIVNAPLVDGRHFTPLALTRFIPQKRGRFFRERHFNTRGLRIAASDDSSVSFKTWNATPKSTSKLAAQTVIDDVGGLWAIVDDEHRSLSDFVGDVGGIKPYAAALNAVFEETWRAHRSKPRDLKQRRAGLAAIVGKGHLGREKRPMIRTEGVVVQDWDLLPSLIGAEGESGSTVGRMRLIRPDDDKVRPALLYLSGHFRQDPAIDDLAREALAAGFVVATVGLAGYDHRKDDTTNHHFGAYLTLFGESAMAPYALEALIAFSILSEHPHVDKTRIGVAGASMGGLLSTVVGALRDDVAAVASMGGTTDFSAYVGGSGSDADQHPPHFAAIGGMAEVVSLIAPRPLMLLFADDDKDHGAAASRFVTAEARRAYASSPGTLAIRSVEGKHDQKRPKRRAIIDFMVEKLNPTSTKAAIKSFPPPSGESVRGKQIWQLAGQLATDARKSRSKQPAWSLPAQAGQPWADDPVRAQTPIARGVDAHVLSARGEARTLLVQLKAAKPNNRILVVDDEGFAGAGFAAGLVGCGVDVFVLEPTSFGHFAGHRQRWQRMWTALAGASLGTPLGIDVARDIATAVQAVENISGHRPEAIVAVGRATGTATLFYGAARQAGPKIVLVDPPAPLRTSLAARQYPPWTAIVPGLLRHVDLDLLAADAGERLVVAGGESIVDHSTRNGRPRSLRQRGARAMAEELGLPPSCLGGGG